MQSNATTSQEMSAIKIYRISIDESKLEHLKKKKKKKKKKLALADFPDELDGVRWSSGPPLSDLQRLTK
jgi:hypothetical protein